MLNEKLPFSNDRINKAENYTTSRPSDSVLIRRKKNDPESISVPSFVKHNCLLGGTQLALAVKRKGHWNRWTYSQYYKEIQLAAKGFIKLGLEPFYTVCIYGFNCPEWLISNLGAIFAQGFSTGLYPTNSASANEYLMINSRCQILVVDSAGTLAKVRPVLDGVRTLKKVVVIEEEGFSMEGNEDCILWKDLLAMGQNESEELLNKRLHDIAANQCCSLIYTSGTTGNPKGVMLSHDNLTYTATGVVEKHKWKEELILVSFLPLSHIAGNMMDIYVALRCRAQVYFADKSAMRGTLVETLKEVRPTLFFSVPRVYEKFQEGIMEKFSHTKKHEKMLTDLFTSAAFRYNTKGNSKLTKSLGEKLFYQKIRTSLGLDRCQEFICGGAPLMNSTEDFFLGLDMIIKPGYGLSECGVVSNFGKGEYKKGSTGTLFSSTSVKVDKESDAAVDGELLIQGRGVMMGYLNNPMAMREAFDGERFFKTGDLGFVDKDGYYFITGRKKELLITAGGENIAPINIEDNIKASLPVVSNVVAIGDCKKFISTFLSLKVSRDEQSGEPTDMLTQSVQDWCRAKGSNATRVSDILTHRPPGVMNAIQKGIDEANAKAVSNAAKVKKWTILPRELTMDAGEIGPTLKLKRNVFYKMHSKQIENFYI